MRRRTSFLFLSLFLLLFLSPVLADEKEIPANIKADRLKFNEETGLVEATGSVEVKLKGITIRSDRLIMDSETNIATAEGNVKMFAADYTAAAETLVYDAENESTKFEGFRSALSPAALKGKLFFNAGHLSEAGHKMQGGPAELTTCERAEPHFFAAADQVSYYPDDHLAGRNVTLFVGEAPVLWLPYFYYDLKDWRRKNWQFGRNEVEGYYLKTAWGYSLGMFLLDYMEKKGLGYGTDSPYGLGALGLGGLYLYHLDEKDTGLSDWIEKIDHRKQINANTELKFNQSYVSTYRIPAGRIEQTAVGLGLNYAAAERWGLNFNLLDDRASNYARYNLTFNRSAGRGSLNYYYNYEFGQSDPAWLRKSQRLSFNQQLSDRINFATTTNYYHSTAGAGDSGEEKVEPQIEFNGREPNYSWRYSENWLVDLRQNNYPGASRYEHLEKHPEIEIAPNSVDLKLFSLQSIFGYGYYREVKNVPELGGNRDYSAARYRTTLNASRSIPAGLSVLTLGAGVDQFLYGPGDQLYALRESASLQTNATSFFRNNIDLRQGYTDGNTPFFFDKLGTSYHDIRERLTFYYLDKFNWTIDGGHNWQANRYYDVMTNLRVTPDPRASFNLTTGWDIENTRYKMLVAGLMLLPARDYNLQLSINQDLNGAGLQTGSALHDLYFLRDEPNQVHLRFSQVYDAATKEFKVRDIMVVKDLHCWEMRFTYSDYRKEYSFVFSLKALPGEPVGFGSGRGFYYEGFERQLNLLNPVGEVRRY
ncbi:hypothetical protein A2625_04230 [candidate division WOR-1 bacterium RIFCSPHIGHO2_01_FULL_53_15]|uniref:Organic solvent tolerance-like N-terminal domain-containing protein n=1 Tax=candidate division WOR-1 bacterium RIFCSPHIGHO2_01_FULL_53_15 TaxID=1802564 RepID=A0A1F4Q2K6_UNCSA|nr:MAG: hypothetical protein A2625_04230 [candidate division WOR-1 bacterium RIFCSPHIGHO2_01_FULL_53_15]